MDKISLAHQTTFPTVMVPLLSPLDAPTKMGHRILMASNGVFLEISRVWGYFIRQVGPALPVPLPYGKCEPATVWKIPRLPLDLITQFKRLACETPDREIGASIIWNEELGYRLTPSISLVSTGSHLKYQLPSLAAGDHLIIDCHSHANHPAFFSSEDNNDDRDSVKLSYVVGHCHLDKQSEALRLCLKRIYENVTLEVI